MHVPLLYHNLLSWDTFNFSCPLSRWQCQYRSCSRNPTQYQSPLAHALPLPRSPITSMHALLTKHARRTSKTSSWTLFVLFCSGFSSFILSHFINRSMVLLPASVIVEVVSFAWFSDIFSPSSFSCLQKNVIYYICTVPILCLLCHGLEWNRFLCKFWARAK